MKRGLFITFLFSAAVAVAAGDVQPEAVHLHTLPRQVATTAPVTSAPTDSHATLPSCWDQAANLHRVNPHLLVAIADVESNHRPVALSRNRNGTLDIGIMQINSVWLPQLEKYGITSRHLLDPCINVHVGAWILSRNMARFGETSWRAVGAYNATRDDLRLRYARKVHDRLTKRLAAASRNGSSPSAVTVTPRIADNQMSPRGR